MAPAPFVSAVWAQIYTRGGVLAAVRPLGSSRDRIPSNWRRLNIYSCPSALSQRATEAAHPRAKLACTTWDSMGMTDFDRTDTGSDTGSLRGISLSALRLRRFAADKVAWALARNDIRGAPRTVICYAIWCKRPAPGTNHQPGRRCFLAGPNRGSCQRGDGEGRAMGQWPLHSTPLSCFPRVHDPHPR